jgi:hypothetical protein
MSFEKTGQDMESPKMSHIVHNGLFLPSPKLGVLFDISYATAAQAATVEHESDRP